MLPGVGPNIAGLAQALDRQVPKVFRHGTHRTSSPDETLARYGPLARQMGITRLGNVTGLDRIGIPVAIAVRPNSRSLAVSQGKGLALSHAMASALMEAIELFHGENLIARTRVASFYELSAEARALAPSVLRGTGKPLPESAKIPWIEGYDLLRRESCWIPWEIVHTDYTLPTDHSSEHFLSGTNGIAAGNHLLEALSAGICELIEHDAVAIWNARGIRERARCRLDLASIDDDDCRALLETYERADAVPRVWNVTSDTDIAAFVCDIPAENNGLRRFRGAGCHPNHAIALARALTEAAQIRLTYITGNRDDLPPSDYEETAREKLGGALLDAASQAVEPLSFHDAVTFEEGDLALDVQWELNCLRSVGVEQAIAIDLTRSDFGIPVIKMVVPSLEWDCTHPNYTPGVRAHSATRNDR